MLRVLSENNQSSFGFYKRISMILKRCPKSKLYNY